MLSIVIATQDSERTLVPTLSALVAGAIAGMVREVIVADAGSRDDTPAIADAAGCRVLTSDQGRGARLKAAADVARGSWLLFLEPGAVPEPTWVDEIRQFVDETELAGRADAAVFRAAPVTFPPMLLDVLAWLRAAFGATPNPGPGLLIAQAHYRALGGHRDVDDAEREFIRRLGRRLVRLRASARACK
jgi:glycosyltransferase involved in cell wall biosynthesis